MRTDQKISDIQYDKKPNKMKRERKKKPTKGKKRKKSLEKFREKESISLTLPSTEKERVAIDVKQCGNDEARSKFHTTRKILVLTTLIPM